jgi:hypothetical protein
MAQTGFNLASLAVLCTYGFSTSFTTKVHTEGDLKSHACATSRLTLPYIGVLPVTLVGDLDHGRIRSQDAKSILASDIISSESDERVAMTGIEEKRETGASLILLGLGVWVVDFLVVFFLPSGIKLGRYATFLGIIIAMGVLGLGLLVIGFKARGKSTAE